jgi:hypothetical protein
MALIGAAPEFGGPGFMLPTRNHEVFKWCLDAGLKLVFQMTLMGSPHLYLDYARLEISLALKPFHRQCEWCTLRLRELPRGVPRSQNPQRGQAL